MAVLVGLYALSIQPVSRLLAAPLEFTYPKYDGQPVEFVVVLGSGHTSDARIPELSQLSRTGLSRLLQGIEVLKQNPGAKLLLSGYGGSDFRSHAEVMGDTALLLGVSPNKIMLAPEAKDTSEEADAWKQLLQKQSFALVTSAMHMPRAMYLFQRHGLSPVAAPANYETAGESATYWRGWLPKSTNLQISEAAWHEYLGLAWARLNSLFS